MIKTFAALTILTMLSGCFCLTDTQDKSDVSEYFSGCWSRLEDEKK